MRNSGLIDSDALKGTTIAPGSPASDEAVVGAGRRAALALAAANAGLNPRNEAARADIASAVAETADFLERNTDALHALEGRGENGTRSRTQRETLRALAENAAQVCVESILSVDQFAELDADVVASLRDLYAGFVDQLLVFPSADEARAALPALIETHRRNMATILTPVAGLLPPPSVPRREAVACAEYSATLQAEILGLDDEAPIGPALDIGCGRHARLIRHLRSRGIETYGIDRFPLSREARADGVGGETIIASDWNSYRFEPGRWGTVLSHLAFSNHFVRHAARAEGRDLAYARKFREIIESLGIGGTFRYAPSLPFVERHLDPALYEVRLRSVGPVGFPFTATIVRRRGDSRYGRNLTIG